MREGLQEHIMPKPVVDKGFEKREGDLCIISPLNIYMHRKREVPGRNSGFTARN